MEEKELDKDSKKRRRRNRITADATIRPTHSPKKGTVENLYGTVGWNASPPYSKTSQISGNARARKNRAIR